ncbi:MAG: SURF1 family protein [Pseudomonadota bacterium]
MFSGMFAALGVWQMKRLAWKQALIARVERNVNAAPAAAPGPAAWPQLERAEAEYRRVRLQGRFAHELETLVGASTELGTGYWVLTPLKTAQGDWVLVNRGFVPPEQKARARRAGAEPTGEQEVVGLLRFSEPGGRLLQDNDPVLGRWYSRDVQAIALARGLPVQDLAPYFVDAVAGPTAAHGWPRAGLTVLRFSNNHAVYAATWFALAAMVACAAGYLVVDERRLAGDPRLANA